MSCTLSSHLRFSGNNFPTDGQFMKSAILTSSRRQESMGASGVETGFLPNFCDNRTVFLLVLIVELLAILLALARNHTLDYFWTDLALTSLLMQWIALMVAALLCRCRRWLAHRRPFAVTLAVFVVAQFSTLLCSLLALQLMFDASFGMINLSNALSALVVPQAMSAIITLLALRYFYMRHQWQHHVQAEARARLQALQARIHPHFLFNTLNVIASLIQRQPDRAEQAVLDLSDLLRLALAQRETITLYEELELTRRYLAIESLRLGERLQVDWRLDPDLPLDLPIPALLLQPLVENAIYHGIQRLPEGGMLTIQIEKQAAALRIVIVNPQSHDDGASYLPGQRIAQNNIRQRLQLTYQTPNPLSVTVTDDRYQVSFILPWPIHITGS